MPISHQHRTIFVHIPRSAGTSLNIALGICTPENKSDNAYRPDALFGFDGRHFAQHLTASEIRARAGDRVFSEYFKFAVVRDPYTRLLSAYYLGFSNGRSVTDIDGFRAFVRTRLEQQYHKPLATDRHRHLKPQSLFICDERGELLVDLVIRYDALDTGLREVGRRIGRALVVPRVNATHAFDPAAHFDEPSRQIVQRLYKEDFLRFGYSV